VASRASTRSSDASLYRIALNDKNIIMKINLVGHEARDPATFLPKYQFVPTSHLVESLDSITVL
jgi:hypothetical protein